jgi:DNA (cytosine-5)-methyltransferase 1
MMTISTLFSGGEGVGVGARAAGIKHLWGIEYDDEIAQVGRDNGFNVVTADVTMEKPGDYERPNVLHASPPCPNFSNAKQGAEETTEDVALAEATARFIEVLLPDVFTLENVYGYRKSESWALIADMLNRCGYWYDLAHVNATDFGVPQARKRMIVRALRGQMVPHLPPPEPWVGWYAAIEDLIPTLPESEFAPWQQIGLPERNIFLVGGQFGQPQGSADIRTPQVVQRCEPAFTVTAVNKGDWRANIQGRVVTMTPRALARFQSFPDSYKLPDKRTLACRIIGNAVPPLLYQKLIAQLVEAQCTK